MARYSLEMNRTASATLSVGGIQGDATRPRRCRIYHWSFGSEATPGDFAFLVQLTRNTTAGTFSALTPNALDPGDPASEQDGAENFSADPTLGAVLDSKPINQRATYQWFANPGQELITPATAANGIVMRTPTAGALVAVTGVFHFDD